MRSYLDLLEKAFEKGEKRDDRTGTGTRSLFGEQLKIDLAKGFPLLTTKKIHFKSVIHELLWMLQGRTNVKWLQERGVTIWDEWADENGDLGPVYGEQWRAFGRRVVHEPVDQIRMVKERIQSHPECRRLLVSAWNPVMTEHQALPPCHYSFQFYVSQKAKLSCMVNLRSCDIFLGLPFNMAQYALLTHIMAWCTGLHPDKLVMSFGDVHLYENHVGPAETQLSRTPRDLPQLRVSPSRGGVQWPWEFEFDDFTVTGYDPDPVIKAQVAV